MVQQEQVVQVSIHPVVSVAMATQARAAVPGGLLPVGPVILDLAVLVPVAVAVAVAVHRVKVAVLAVMVPQVRSGMVHTARVAVVVAVAVGTL